MKTTKNPRTDTGWAAYLGAGMELILRARTREEAQRIAKERLGTAANKQTGIPRISDELRARWILAVNGPANTDLEQGILDGGEMEDANE